MKDDAPVRILALAGIGNQDEELEREINGFFGEAFINLLSILSRGGAEASDPAELVVEFETLNPSRKSTRPEASRRKEVGLAPA